MFVHARLLVTMTRYSVSNEAENGSREQRLESPAETSLVQRREYGPHYLSMWKVPVGVNRFFPLESSESGACSGFGSVAPLVSVCGFFVGKVISPHTPASQH